MNGRTDGQTDRRIDKQTNRQTDEQADRQKDEQTDGQTETERRTDEQTERRTGGHVPLFAVGVDDEPLLGGSDREDARLRRVDDRRERLDAEHPEVRDGEGTALETERKRNTPGLETVKVPPWRRNANGCKRNTLR